MISGTLLCNVMQDTAIRNLDYIFTVAAPSIMNASPEILANLERLLDEKSSEPWSHRRLPTMTATYPAVIDSDAEGDDAGGFPRLRDSQKPASKLYGMSGYGNFLQKESNAEQAVSKQIDPLTMGRRNPAPRRSVIVFCV